MPQKLTSNSYVLDIPKTHEEAFLRHVHNTDPMLYRCLSMSEELETPLTLTGNMHAAFKIGVLYEKWVHGEALEPVKEVPRETEGFILKGTDSIPCSSGVSFCGESEHKPRNIKVASGEIYSMATFLQKVFDLKTTKSITVIKAIIELLNKP